MALTFRQVRHFVATAETGQVSAAAAGLNVTQSAVTASIKALETELGRKLFDRHSNGVTLTFDGQQFLQRARAIEASVSDAMRGPHRWGTQVDGTVDIAVSYTVAGYFMPPLLSRFWRAFPGITVRLHEFERDAIEHSLMSGSVDAAVMLVSNLHDRRSIRSRLLLRSPRRLWACANHPLLHKDSVRLADLAGEPFLMLTVDEASRPAWASPFCPTWSIGRGRSKDIESISRRWTTKFTPWTSASPGRARPRSRPRRARSASSLRLLIPDRSRFSSIEARRISATRRI